MNEFDTDALTDLIDESLRDEELVTLDCDDSVIEALMQEVL